MLRIFLILSIAFAVGCTSGNDKQLNENTVKVNDDTSSVMPGVFEDIDGCYMQVLKRDSFVARLQQQEGLVHGKMSFNNFEKDKSSGPVSGKLEGDILKLNYTFLSEGTKSIMELYFKYKDGILLRGIGEMNTRGDTAYFVNPALIKYDGGELKKISCQILAEKYK